MRRDKLVRAEMALGECGGDRGGSNSPSIGFSGFDLIVIPVNFPKVPFWKVQAMPMRP